VTRRRPRRAGLALLAAVCACARPPAAPSARAPADAVVVVKSNVADAQLYVDGRLVASLERLARGVSIAPGRHRLELRRESYFSRYVELELGRAERRRVELPLAPILP